MTDAFRTKKYSNFTQEDSQREVILNLTIYVSAGDRIRIRAVDVKTFGHDSSPNQSTVDKDTFLLIRKLF